MMETKVEIDNSSGFCFGVVTAIRKAEEALDSTGSLYCLGDIVHNSDEVERLRSRGLITITHEQMASLRNVKVLLRAHGEPPSTYELARRNNIEIIDATCPVVLQLQKRIKSAYSATEPRPQIVIYGKNGHAEVNGLVGQTDGDAIVVEDAPAILPCTPRQQNHWKASHASSTLFPNASLRQRTLKDSTPYADRSPTAFLIYGNLHRPIT